MKPITAIISGVLLASIGLPVLAGDDVVHQALQASQNNYRGDAATYLEQHGIQPTQQNKELFNQYRDTFDRAD
jgi:hypothetical protein